MKIRLLRPAALDRTTYVAGVVIETDDPWARVLVRRGHAKLVIDEEQATEQASHGELNLDDAPEPKKTKAKKKAKKAE